MDSNLLIVGCVGFVGLWIAYHAWTTALRSVFRQQLFRLRDRMFLAAARGELSFSDPAYGMLRTIMQRTLRMSEHINLIQVLTTILVSRTDPPTGSSLHDAFEACLEEMDDERRVAEYRRYYRLMHIIIATHFVRCFPIPIVGALFVFLAYRLPGAIWLAILERIRRGQPERAATQYVESAYRCIEASPAIA